MKINYGLKICWSNLLLKINNGALVNRAVSEAEMGSPTRGEDQVHMLLKLMTVYFKWCEDIYINE